MHPQTRRALVGKSFPTDLIDRIAAHGHSVANLQSFSRQQLEQFYSSDDATFIQQKVNRNPIDAQVLDAVLQASAEACAYCADGNSSRPYQIHHIVPYAETQDDRAENLLVVCPTCHVALHSRRDSIEVQNQTRARWHAIAAVSQAYAAKGLTFPFGAFEAVHYGGEVSAASLLEPTLPPRLAQELSTHSLATSLASRLAKNHFALVTGQPGCGKSTLIVGVAGEVGDRRVFRYRASRSQDNRDATAELLTFIASASVAAVLLIDDVNLILSDADLEALASAASATVKVIASMTSENYDSKAELHLREHCTQVHWDALREQIVKYCAAHEVELTAALRAIRRPDDDLERVGLGTTETSARTLARRYAEVSTSAWQFRFLLCGGWGTIRDDVQTLVADAAFLPVLFASIEQIAGVERFVTPHESAVALENLSESPLSETWIATVFENLCSRRVMVKRRDGYSTIHREWARAFISACLDNDKTARDARLLLSRDFDLTTDSPRRLMILWSWFYYDRGGAGKFVQEWTRTQAFERWPKLIETAAARSLVDIAMVASRLHLLFHGEQWRELIAGAYAVAHAQLVTYVCNATPKDWYWLRELFMGVDYASDEVVRRIVHECDPTIVATLIEQTLPANYENVSWFLSGVGKHSPDWVAAVGRSVNWESISAALAAIEPGQVENVCAAYDVLYRLRRPIMRSHVRRLSDAIRDCLGAARLDEIYWWRPIYYPAFLFPSETCRFAEKLDAASLAAQLMSASPVDWRRMSVLLHMLSLSGSPFPVELVRNLDAGALAEKLSREGRADPYATRTLLWQLVHGKGERGDELATALYAPIRDICMSGHQEVHDIARAFAALSSVHGERLMSELALSPEALESDKNGAGDAGANKRDAFAEIAAYFETLDAGGVDYDVQAAMDAYSTGHESEGDDAN